jgi:serine protease Do
LKEGAIDMVSENWFGTAWQFNFFKKVVVLALFSFAWPALAYKFPEGNDLSKSDARIANLQKLSEGVAAITEKTQSALVFISVSKTIKGMPFNMLDPFEFFFGVPNPNNRRNQAPPKQEGMGSGFFIDLDKGYIITNNHVIDGADEINLKLSNGETYEGTVIGRDQNTDVAVVQVKDSKYKRDGLVALSFGDSDKLKAGDFVVALGAPFGLEASISFGVVSALGRGNLGITQLGNFIQTDAAINPGNSGGPLLNTFGQVIGVNTAIFSKSGGYAGIGFAVPSKLVMSIGQQLVASGKVTRGYIGAGLQSLSQELAEDLKVPKGTKGISITHVMPGDPAAKGGLKDGDVIIRIDKANVTSADEVINTIGLKSPGTKVDFEIVRNGKLMTVPIVIGTWPGEDPTEVSSKPAEESGLGLTVGLLDKAAREQFNLRSPAGVVVTAVKPDSVGAQFGIRVGDLIVAVDQVPIKTVGDFNKAISKKKRLLIRFERSGQFFFLPIRL